MGQLSSLVQIEREEDNVDMIHTRSLEYPVGLNMAVEISKLWSLGFFLPATVQWGQFEDPRALLRTALSEPLGVGLAPDRNISPQDSSASRDVL